MSYTKDFLETINYNLKTYYGVPNKHTGTIIKSQEKIFPTRVGTESDNISLAQSSHNKNSILKQFIDHENLQIYAQMYRILTALSLKYHTSV